MITHNIWRLRLQLLIGGGLILGLVVDVIAANHCGSCPTDQAVGSTARCSATNDHSDIEHSGLSCHRID